MEEDIIDEATATPIALVVSGHAMLSAAHMLRGLRNAGFA